VLNDRNQNQFYRTAILLLEFLIDMFNGFVLEIVRLFDKKCLWIWGEHGTGGERIPISGYFFGIGAGIGVIYLLKTGVGSGFKIFNFISNFPLNLSFFWTRNGFGCKGL